MRGLTSCLVIAIVACRPSATTVRTTPVANLQSYKTVALRVKAGRGASQNLPQYLEGSVLHYMRGTCGFERVVRAGTPADLQLDLNIVANGRGGTGMIRNPNMATLDTLLVLSDGQGGELLGTARIHGQSSGIVMNNAAPENEAIDVVAKSVVELLATSGCGGPRVARVETPVVTPPPPPPPTGSGTTPPPPPPPDESHRAEAEALNDQGKDKLRSADVQGALAAFQQANTVLPDARYQFNVCLAYEAEEQWSNAVAACRQARSMNPQAALASKIDKRVELLGQHH